MVQPTYKISILNACAVFLNHIYIQVAFTEVNQLPWNKVCNLYNKGNKYSGGELSAIGRYRA